MNRLYADGTLCLFSGAGNGEIQRQRQSEKTKTQTERDKHSLKLLSLSFFSLTQTLSLSNPSSLHHVFFKRQTHLLTYYIDSFSLARFPGDP